MKIKWLRHLLTYCTEGKLKYSRLSKGHYYKARIPTSVVDAALAELNVIDSEKEADHDG